LFQEIRSVDLSFEVPSLITNSDIDRMKSAMNTSDFNNILSKRRRLEQGQHSVLDETSFQAQPHPLPKLESVPEEQENASNALKEIRKKGRKVKQVKISLKKKNGKFPCKCCLRPFSSKHDARQHALTHKTWEELEGETVYHEKCEQCHKIFFNKGHFQAHSDMHKGVRRHKCYKCNKAFTLQGNLIRHSMVHLGAEEKAKVKEGWKNNCYFCNKKFRGPSDLIRHMVTHTREKPFKCITCRKTFTTNGALTVHKRCHSEETRRAFKCGDCDKSFTQKGYLSTHHKTVHLAQKNVKCSQFQCPKLFGTQSDMKRHLNAVHRKITHKCPHCPKTYLQKGKLQTHVKKVHEN
jgi:KRAB domain-containing zinc finger protein